MIFAATLCLGFSVLIILLDTYISVIKLRNQSRNPLINRKSVNESTSTQKWVRYFYPLPSIGEIKNIISNHQPFRQRILAYIELSVLGIWGIIIGSAYLDFDPRVMPAGVEFSSTIHSHYFWFNLKDCGVCALWNGSIRGGFPAMADLQSSMLHPLVAVTTFIWGVVNGVKVSLVVTFWIAGLAQWWIAHELKVSRLPRMWSAMAAMAGGHLTGRMELGIFGVLLSTAMASLFLAAILHHENTKTNRTTVLLALIGAFTIVSGQGYIQAGLMGILPAALIFIIGDKQRLARHWTSYLIAGILGLMLAAHFLVPLLHFGQNIAKEMDAEFNASQPLKYLVLNLVIDDLEFHHLEILGKLPYPYLYSLYIGWPAVILAIFGITKIKQKDWRIFGFLILGITLAFLIAGGSVLRYMALAFPFVGGIRHASQIAGLAIPLILGLSAYGLENILQFPWPKLFVSRSDSSITNPIKPLPLHWFILLPILFLNIKGEYEFSKAWLYTEKRDDGFYDIVNALKYEPTQWVEPPFGEHAFIEPSIAMGYKLSPGILNWTWINREMPKPKINITREGVPPGNVILVGEVRGLFIYENLDVEYASINADDNKIPCQAEAKGGLIKVICDSDAPGLLTIQENYWSGWRVWVDGKEASLESSQWLEVNAPQGRHTYTFRYLPWDVFIGLIIFIVGIVISLLLWLHPDQGLVSQLATAETPQDDAFETVSEKKTEIQPVKRKKAVRNAK